MSLRVPDKESIKSLWPLRLTAGHLYSTDLTLWKKWPAAGSAPARTFLNYCVPDHGVVCLWSDEQVCLMPIATDTRRRVNRPMRLNDLSDRSLKRSPNIHVHVGLRVGVAYGY